MVVTIAKQQASQKFIFKLHTGRLRKAKWELTLPVSEARRNDEVITLSDSQMLRWIDELNGLSDSDTKAKKIKADIKAIRKQNNSLQNRRIIKRLYEELDNIQYKPDYLCLVIDRAKDYWRACKGFTVNGIKYVRLLGTNGGIKNSTIVFVSERLYPELKRRIDNGRRMDVELVPAKLETYRALVCSASIPVSHPHGILVVNDCETKFLSDVISLNDECDGEPDMTMLRDFEVTLDESDGYGLMLPSLAARWSSELHLDYTVSGVNTRFAWEKGMIFCFDFIEFADKVAGQRFVKDAWGNEVDITTVELILTTSMLKLWDCYDSCDQYIECCRKNKYSFGIAKTCPKKLENERSLNYQFIQSYELDDEQIECLVSDSIKEINDVLSHDFRKTILFLKGYGLSEDNIEEADPDFVKAMMIDSRIFGDSFVKKRIYELIKKRIADAKIGVIKVHGNYSMISGDPYALCQNMFGLNVTGLLKPKEIYNRYWLDSGSKKVVCFRAPMTCHNNIRLMDVAGGEEPEHWYQYMTTCTILNAWDTTTHALNGADKDGDLVLLTDNETLVRNTRELPAIMCIQRRARKCIVTEKDLIQSNIDSFGNDIGKTTNWITSMFNVKAQFQPESQEYKTLEYRIKCGQTYQQNAIDKAKGIICKSMPKEWYDRGTAKKSYTIPSERAFNLRILADKKPYFMRYIYPSLMKQYNTYIKDTNRSALREFRRTVDELIELPESELDQREKDFIRYYKSRMPVGIHDCVMNRICRRFEKEFDGYIGRYSDEEDFDYTIMKSGVDYSPAQYNAILKIYETYKRRVQDYMQYIRYERADDVDLADQRRLMIREFEADCFSACSDSACLCDIILDICYQHEGSKQFAWDICSHEIIENLISRNDGNISFPIIDPDGDIEFGGERFSFITTKIGGDANEHYSE